MGGKILILALLGAWMVLGDWSGTRRLYTASVDADKDMVHINPDTGTVHTLGYVGTQIIYRQYKNGQLGPTTILSSRAASVDYVEIITAKKLVVIFFDSTRSGIPATECSARTTDGCQELYIMESINDGFTWSTPVPVPRDDFRDIAHRAKASAAYDSEAGLIYVTYSFTNATSGQKTIRMARKNLTESYFRKEQELVIPTLRAHSHPKIGVTHSGKYPHVLHLAFLAELGGKNSSVYYSNSVDYGVTWKKPQELTPEWRTGRHILSLHALGFKGTQEVFMSYTENYGSDLLVMFSFDAGHTWGKLPFLNGENLVPYVRGCGKTKTHGAMLTVFSEQSQQFQIFYFNATSNFYDEYPVPFKEFDKLENLPMGDCMIVKEPELMFVMGAASHNLLLFDDYNYKKAKYQ